MSGEGRSGSSGGGVRRQEGERSTTADRRKASAAAGDDALPAVARRSASPGREEGPAKKRRRIEFGDIARGALEQWGLDEHHVARWASRKGLAGVGIADLLEYRRQYPELDIAIGVSEL